jgi:hypothetical protein
MLDSNLMSLVLKTLKLKDEQEFYDFVSELTRVIYKNSHSLDLTDDEKQVLKKLKSENIDISEINRNEIVSIIFKLAEKCLNDEHFFEAILKDLKKYHENFVLLMKLVFDLLYKDEQ